MSDLTPFWNIFIIALTVIGIIGLFVLTYAMSLGKRKPGEKVNTMGHVWDEDLKELNNPLPRWWLNLFYITLVFSVGYLLLYPGLGEFRGLLNWSQTKQYEQEVKDANARFGPLYEKYRGQDLYALATDPEALRIGERLFANYCTSCHGTDTRGGPGFPNLRDQDWLYGGDPATIETSILQGRSGVMPAWEPTLGAEGVAQVTEYVLSLSGHSQDAARAEMGKAKFGQLCAACHMPDGTGNPALGAPNLTDGVWLYGGARATVMQSIAKGRQGRMPAHAEFLGEAKVHLLAAYVFSLSHRPRQ